MNIKLTIEYIGTDFSGWQKQPNKLNIQGRIEKAIYDVTGQEVELIGAGRTDAGVHALGQVANFKIDKDIDLNKLPIALNSKLKGKIIIKKAEEVDENFHSRYNAKKRIYRYVINNNKTPSAFYDNLELFIQKKLDVDKMNKAIKYIEGEHDFAAFKSSGTSSKNSCRTIYNAEVKRIIRKEINEERIYIEITGSGFLYNMVRIIAGTLIEVGLGKRKPEELKEILESKDRKKAGKTALAKGLFLISVE